MSDRTTRRDLFALAGAGLIAPALSAQERQNLPASAPELVVFNARIFTIDSPRFRNSHIGWQRFKSNSFKFGLRGTRLRNENTLILRLTSDSENRPKTNDLVNGGDAAMLYQRCAANRH